MKQNEEASSFVVYDFLANMSTYIFILFLILSFVVLASFMACICKKTISNAIKKALIDFKNDTFFGNAIKGQTIIYLNTTLSFIIFAKKINFNAGFGTIILSLSPFLLVFVYPVGASVFLCCFKRQLNHPRIKESFDQLYYGIDLKKGDWAI